MIVMGEGAPRRDRDQAHAQDAPFEFRLLLAEIHGREEIFANAAIGREARFLAAGDGKPA